MSAFTRRRNKAIFVLLACLVAAILVDKCVAFTRPGVLSEAWQMMGLELSNRAESNAGKDGMTANNFFGEAQGDDPSKQLGEGVVPAGFAEEVFPLDVYTQVRVGAEGAVVGFTSSSPPLKTFSDIGRALEERGWTAVPSGSEVMGSFVKTKGPRTWVFVSCVQQEASTGVVVQCLKSDE